MVLVDTSVWIEVLRDARGEKRAALHRVLDGEEAWLSRFCQLELLQGCRDEKEWSLLTGYLEAQDYLEPAPGAWSAAARVYYDLRRLGRTVRSPIDCCIAQLALDYDLLVLHCDRDFETIARVRPLRHLWFEV